MAQPKSYIDMNPMARPAYQIVAEPGWPRPFREGPRQGRMLPVPWVAGTTVPGEIEWTTFHQHMARDAIQDKLCQVCGERLGWVKILGLMQRRFQAAQFGERNTSGPAMHPRCAAMAFQFCPHFPEGPEAVVGARYTGPGLGFKLDAWFKPPEYEGLMSGEPLIYRNAVNMTRAEVKVLAKDNPLGERR